MSSAAAIDFDTIEAQVRADAERKVTVLREIVDTHTDLTREREAFLSADADRVRRLTALLAEASAAGFDRKTLAPFHAEPLSTKRPAPRKRSTPPRTATAAPTAGADTPAAATGSPATDAPVGG